MLVERSAFEAQAFPTETQPAQTKETAASRGRGRGRGRGQGGAVGRAKQGREHAEAHGLKRGSCGAQHDSPPTPYADPPIPRDAPAEGLYAFIQSRCCRRQVLGRVFNDNSVFVAPSTGKDLCCDICNPGLFDQVRCLCAKLFTWRLETKRRDYSHASFSAAALLSNELTVTRTVVGSLE